MSKNQNMQVVADRFYNQQRNYYMDNMQDETLMEATTQPFWQSMRLSKRRLQEKGLKMDLAIIPQHSKMLNLDKVFVHRDGTDEVGSSTRAVLTKRTFYHQGKKIYHKKEHDFSVVNVLKAHVEGGNAACPNCGANGTISSFVDGCDYCGSKFTVKDFEPKVSGFVLEENIQKKVKSTLLKTLALLLVLTLLLIVISFISGAMLVVYAMTSQESKGIVFSVLSLLGATEIIPVVWNTVVTLAVMYSMFGFLLLFLFPKQIKQEAVVKAVIPDFSSQDFFQNLEYKLRNIHLTDSAKEVSAFSSFDLSDVVVDYRNVVDCHVRSLKYLSTKQTSLGYELQVEVKLKLSVFNGRKVRVRYETIALTLSGKTEILQKSTAAIREYKCPNCARSISLLEGGVCEYCGTSLDYENYGWKIEKYEKKKKLIHTYNWISLVMILIYILVFAFHYMNADVMDGEAIGLFEELMDAEQMVLTFYDEIETPEQLGLTTKLVEQKEEFLSRRCVYTSEDVAALAKEYRLGLEQKGMVCDEKSATESAYKMYRRKEYQGDTGYIKVSVSVEDSQMIVQYDIVEYIGE